MSEEATAINDTSKRGATEVESIDLRRYWAAFRKYLWTFVALSVGVFALVLAAAFVLPKSYTATSELVIDPQLSDTLDIKSTPQSSQKPADPTLVDDEVQLLQSRALVERVVTGMRLYADPEFNSAGLPAGAKPGAPPPQDVLDDTVDAVTKHLKVTRQGLTNTIDLTFTAKDPDKAAKIANGFADTYVVQNVALKLAQNGVATDALSTKLASLAADVQRADAALQQYRIQHNLLGEAGPYYNVTPSYGGIAQQQVTQFNSDLAKAQAEQADAEAQYNAARAQMAGAAKGQDVSNVLDSHVIQDLRAQRANISRQMADMQSRYGDRYPAVIQGRQQLADLDHQISAEVSRIVSSLAAQVQVAQQRTAAAQANVNATNGRLAQNTSAQVGLNELQRNFDAARAIHDAFLTKYNEMTGQNGLVQSDARIQARATPPSDPSFPNKLLMAAMGVVLGLSSGVSGVVLRNMLDAGIATGEQVERLLGVRFLGSLPLVGKTQAARTDVATFPVEKPLSAYADGLRNLRASISFSRPGTEVRVISLTSALPGEGKTSVAIGLARSIAMSGASVVLIDCDVRRASSARALGITPDLGLVEFLRNEAPLDKVLRPDVMSSAVFIPIARPRPDADDLVSSNAMRKLLEHLKGQFQYVILDTAPVLAVADTRILSTMADVNVVLARWRSTPRKATEAALTQLETVGAFVAGVALTQVDLAEQARSGYGDATYYYEHYRSYYTE